MAHKLKKPYWLWVPPWIILGAVVILVTIFVFWTVQNIHKQKKDMIQLLSEKGAALIRSFEAGTRTGMMGMMGPRAGAFRLQELLMETAQQPDIAYLIVTSTTGRVVADSDPDKIGTYYGNGLDLKTISRAKTVQWRQLSNPGEPDVFEVFRRFSPTQIPFRDRHGMMRHRSRYPEDPSEPQLGPDSGKIIFVGLDMGPIEAARKQDTRHTILMAAILLLIGFAGMVSLFLAQAFQTTRTSLTRIKAFSDNVVKHMPVGLVAVDSRGNIASFNETAESVLHQPSNEMLGKAASGVIPSPLWALTKTLKPGKQVLATEVAWPLAGGTTIPLEVSVSMLEGEEGGSLGYVILFRDLTEVRDLQKEIETSRRLASLGRLAAGIAHEIRNPLSSIKGFATYFRERYRDNPEDEKTAQVMIQEVDRLNRVIGQLLEFARPLAMHKKPVRLQGLIKHALKLVEKQAQANKINIETALPAEIGPVSVDPDRLNQVFLNLFFNAMEAMEKGGLLSVTLSKNNETPRVRVTVTDTGVGISEQDLEHVFDPYFTTRQTGTGLGLAIVHKIIESHKGEVKVDSEVGKGTTVTLFLPASPTSAYEQPNDPSGIGEMLQGGSE
jgi:two-component system sensor histidine kinase HydH